MFCRYGRAAWLSLAASLGIHGIAVGGLVLSGQLLSPDLSGGNGAPGTAGSGGVLTVHLFEAPAAPGQSVASADVSTTEAETQPIQLAAVRAVDLPKRVEPRRDSVRPALAMRAASDERPPPRDQHPAAGSPPSQLVTGLPSHLSGPAGGQLPGVHPGTGSGYDIGPLDRVARPEGSIDPHYPALARQRGEEADVTVDVWVGARGEVDQVAVSRSAGTEFDAAAIEAVQRARFYPALRDGERVPSRVALLLHFRLER